MSAFGGKADMTFCGANICFGPKADIGASLNGPRFHRYDAVCSSGVTVRRREFLGALGSAAAWPLVARAQQAGRLPTIGFLGPDTTPWSPWTASFVQRLRELGWIDGRTIAIEYRWAVRPERIAEIAAEFVRLKVDVMSRSEMPCL